MDKKKILIRQIKSTIRSTSNQKACVRGLGLRRIRHSVYVEDTPSMRGMVNKVRHLVELLETSDKNSLEQTQSKFERIQELPFRESIEPSSDPVRSENIKSTAIPAAGYIYQNRQGLKVLCDWLDAPTRYSRVKFECDDKTEAPQALDDIVIERSDGLVDLQQVKFTPNPEKYLLCWDWMLEKTGKTARSRSLLRKWFDAFKRLDPQRTGEISLVTNRRPDASIEACLIGGMISFAKVQEPMRSQLITELGSVEECEVFFSQLHIRHSDREYIGLEHEVDSRLRKHGTSEGIAILKYVALDWAIQKNSPLPDG